MPRSRYGNEEDPGVCEKCGEKHYRYYDPPGKWYQTCVGHRTGDKTACKNVPIHGGKVCHAHGGAVGHVKTVAATRASWIDAVNVATKGLTSVGIEVTPDMDPINELLMGVFRSRQAVNWLAVHVAELKTPELEGDIELRDVDGVMPDGSPRMVQARAFLYGPNRNGELKVHPLVGLWNEERDRHAKLSKAAVDAGISERMVRIAEVQGDMVVEVIRYAFDKLALDVELRDRAVQIIAERFYEMESGVVPMGLPVPSE